MGLFSCKIEKLGIVSDLSESAQYLSSKHASIVSSALFKYLLNVCLNMKCHKHGIRSETDHRYVVILSIDLSP